ncbi:hypothetical protein [Microbacterium sp. B19]|uniref:hypothetical protein n=1 Tax=Microbacterium sp. B19 TaxID=96765 RepID=UPI000346C435|nr:hypothetical protein [Microbacterium sp. B19]
MIRPAFVRSAAAAVLSIALVGAGIGAGPFSGAQAAAPPSTSAYGIQMLDADGGTLRTPAPLSEWTSGDTVSGSLADTGDVFSLNTTRTTGLDSRAASDGAQASVASGTFQLRDRVPVTFTGLRVECATDGSTSLSLDSLTVDGKDVLDRARLSSGYTLTLPTSPTWGSTKLIVGERTVDRGRVQVTGLRIEAEAGWSEIWRVRLGVAACAPDTSAPARPAVVSGITVTAPSGAALLTGGPRLSEDGSASAQDVRSAGSPSVATDVRIGHAADASSTFSVGSFTQIPDTSAVGEYRWSALRVYGLSLTVNADGSSRIAFADTGSAVFVNGIWINTGTDLYTGVDADGVPRVRVHLNERVPQADGSILITALRYEDLTGAYPSVSLGTVRWTAAGGTPTPAPTGSPSPQPPLPPRYAFAVEAEGPSVIAPAVVADRDAAAPAAAPAPADVSDGGAGQIDVRGATTRSSADASAVSIDALALYPGTRVEVSLGGLDLEVGPDSTTLTTSGGTVAGQEIPAGVIAPNTRVSVPGRSLVVILNAQTTEGQNRTVVAVDAQDRTGLGAHVRVGVVTADAPAVEPEPGPGTSPRPVPSSEPTPPAGSGSESLVPGPIGKDDGPPAPTASGALPPTGIDGSATLTLVLAGLGAGVVGIGAVVFARRRRSTR